MSQKVSTGLDSMPEFMTVRELADHLRVSRMTIYRLIERGEIESVRLNRTVRVVTASARKLLGGGR